jgi:chloride channel protein, CIC family
MTETPPPDPLSLLKSRSYVQLLLLAAIVGVPISAIAYGFLELVDALQTGLFTDLPKELGFESAPLLWPVPLLAMGGLLTALAIRLLPGTGGHSPADGFKAGAVTLPIDLPGVFCAALATLSFGAVLGPEAPLIAIGSGLGMLAVRLAARDAPDTAGAVIAAAGSFAAISTLMGSPLLGAFLLLEAAGLAGPMVGVVLLPGLLAAGVGSLIFIGLDHITGLGTFSLTIPDVPEFGDPTVAMFGWALAFGLVAPFLGLAIRSLALFVRPRVEPRMVLLMPLLGVVVAGLAIGFGEATDKSSSEVLFSGQSAVGALVSQAATWSTDALLLLIACKSLAYALCLSSFRGGPIFPAIFIGAAGGVAAADLPGMSLVPGVAMGMGAMSAVMLGLPLTSTLLAALLLGTPALNALPLVIVAVVVAHVVSARLTPSPEAQSPVPEAPSGSPTPATDRTDTPRPVSR